MFRHTLRQLPRLTRHVSSRARDEPPSFKTIGKVAVLGTLVFIIAVNQINQPAPKLSYSEKEYENVMNGLRRRVAAYQDVSFTSILNGDCDDKDKVIIRTRDLAEKAKSSGKYEALLTDLYAQYGDKYYDNLPVGLLMDLIHEDLKSRDLEGKGVVLIDFPNTVKDAIKFEREIGVIESVGVKGGVYQDVVDYYGTVDKVKKL